MPLDSLNNRKKVTNVEGRDCCSLSSPWCTFSWSSTSCPAPHPTYKTPDYIGSPTIIQSQLRHHLFMKLSPTSPVLPILYNFSLWSPQPNYSYLIGMFCYAQSHPIRKLGCGLSWTLGLPPTPSTPVHRVDFSLASIWISEWILQGELEHSFTQWVSNTCCVVKHCANGLNNCPF